MKFAITLDDTVRQTFRETVKALCNYSEINKMPEGGGKKKGVPPKIDNIGLHKTHSLIPANIFQKMYIPDSEEEYYDLIHGEYAFNIFGNCPLTYPNAVADLNKLYFDIVNSGNQCTILSHQIGNSKTATLLFLSVNKCIANNIKFVADYSKIWQSFDVVITASPYILSKKNPKNPKKKSFKVETLYNKKNPSDFSCKEIGDLISLSW
jgi:hypothetical protein